MKQRSVLALLFPLCLVLSEVISAYKVLIIPVHSKSHTACLLSIADELDRRGHEVHMLQFDQFGMSMKSETNGSTIKQFIFNINTELAKDESKNNMVTRLNEFIRRMTMKRTSFEGMIQVMDESLYLDLCSMIATNTEETFERLKKERFDVAVIDGTAFTKCYYLIPHRLGIPWITYTDYPEEWLMRAPWLPSFVPQQYTKFSERMTFTERLKNMLHTSYLYLKAPQLTIEDDVMTKYRGYGAFETLDDLTRRSQLFLLSSDLVLDYPKPSMPNMIEVGGLTTREPKKLPDEIQTFMDAAEKGVVLMTFGGMLPTLSKELFEKFLSVFRRLDGYRVIWRMINYHNVTLPGNVMMSSWLPQNDILAHHKTKLFITHCGNNGQFEAVYNKVPMIGFPLFADQEYNSIRIEYKGYGLLMDIFDFSADQLFSNVQKILTDPNYNSQISRGSEIFKNAKETPAERAAERIEHVLKFGGSHLRSAGTDLPMYQYLLLDVLLTCMAAVAIIIIAVYKIIYYLWKKCSIVGIHSKGRKQNKEE